VKEYLSQRGFPFTDRDTAQDPTAQAEIEALGVLSVPVTVIDGEVLLGFDPAALERLLGG
jgi:glutaredoxin-like protein NrdH